MMEVLVVILKIPAFEILPTGWDLCPLVFQSEKPEPHRKNATKNVMAGG